MADESAGLLVEIGTTQARMERELARLVKRAEVDAGKMEKAFGAANQNIATSAGKSFERVGKSAQTAGKAGADGLNATRAAATNLSYQLSDITVQLAGGQSPFLIMLQQGGQVTGVLQGLQNSGKGIGAALVGAFSTALSPISLLTYAVIGLSGYAIQYFSELISGGENANKSLEDQKKLIQEIANTWGSGIPAVDAYIAKLNEAKNAADALAAVKILTAEMIAPTTKELKDVTVEAVDFLSKLREAGTEATTINTLNDAFNKLKTQVSDGKATQEDFNAVVSAAQTASDEGGVGVGNFITVLEKLRVKAIEVANEVSAMNGSISAATNAALNNPAYWRGAQTDYRVLNQNEGGSAYGPTGPLPLEGPTPNSRPSDLDSAKARGYSAPKKSGGGRGASAYTSEVEGIKERTAALRESTAAQAAINPLVDDYGFALEKAKAEQKLLADAERQKITITPQLREEISNLATAYATAHAEAKKLDEQQKEIRDTAKQVAATQKEVFGGFLKDIKNGISATEALGNALNKLADKLLDSGIDALFSGKGGGGGGFFGSIFSGIGKIFGFATGTSNTGGSKGQPRGIVHGQEAVIPLADGDVPVKIDQPNVREVARTSSRDTVDINLTDDSGRMAEIADQRIQTSSGTIVRVAVRESYKSVKTNMPNLISDAQSRAG